MESDPHKLNIYKIWQRFTVSVFVFVSVSFLAIFLPMVLLVLLVFISTLSTVSKWRGVSYITLGIFSSIEAVLSKMKSEKTVWYWIVIATLATLAGWYFLNKSRNNSDASSPPTSPR